MRLSDDLRVSNICAMACAGVATGAAMSHFGAAGTLVGAGLGPILFTVVKETVLGGGAHLATRVAPSRTAPTGTSADRDVSPRPHRRGLVLVTGTLAGVVALAAFVLPEVVAGRSLLPGRDTVVIRERVVQAPGRVVVVERRIPATTTAATPSPPAIAADRPATSAPQPDPGTLTSGTTAVPPPQPAPATPATPAAGPSASATDAAPQPAPTDAGQASPPSTASP